MSTRLCSLWFAGAMLALFFGYSAHPAAQGGVNLSGTLTNSLSGAAISNAVVQIDELRRTTTSNTDGMFSFSDVPPGTYHLSVHTEGYSTRRTEVTVGTTAVTGLAVSVDPELHFTEQVSVTGDLRSQFEVYQPTAVLAGQDLQKQVQMSLGNTLENQPGVAARSFGPAPSRPVVRGLDGDRVQILQDGQRMGDLSSQSGDHGVTVNPASAERIEVVRGPATLLYGANAIGGLVNVITEDIPTRAINGTSGNMTFDLGSAADEGGAAADFRAGTGKLAFHAAGGGRRSGDVQTPEGELEDRLPEFEASYPGRELDIAEAEEFPIIENVAADSVLQGIEVHGDFGVTSNLFAEFTLDYVRGSLKDTDDPLPRIPPFRTNIGVRYQINAFQVGGNVIAVAQQDRVFGEETPTDGYGLLRLYGVYSVQAGKALHTITARLDNVTNELYRNHLSLIEDLAPEMGRNFKLLYNVKF